MTVIVKDNGFQSDDWIGAFVSPDELTADAIALDLASDATPEELAGKLDGIEMIRIAFPSFSDGRGFTIARQLRLLGFKGRLRAVGHVIADQYAMARRAGFDEVEISSELSERQDEAQWLARADWRGHNYQSRLRSAL